MTFCMQLLIRPKTAVNIFLFLKPACTDIGVLEFSYLFLCKYTSPSCTSIEKMKVWHHEHTPRSPQICKTWQRSGVRWGETNVHCQSMHWSDSVCCFRTMSMMKDGRPAEKLCACVVFLRVLIPSWCPCVWLVEDGQTIQQSISSRNCAGNVPLWMLISQYSDNCCQWIHLVLQFLIRRKWIGA